MILELFNEDKDFVIALDFTSWNIELQVEKVVSYLVIKEIHKEGIRTL